MKRLKGFTLIEIIIVIAIIALLMVAAFFLARGQFVKGRDARRKADIHKIQEAVEEYEKDHDCYPQPNLVVCNPGTGLVPYLSKVPCDFATGDNYYYENDNATCAKWYRVFIFLDNQNDKSRLSLLAPYSKYNFYLASPNAPVPEYSSVLSSTPPAGSNSYYGCKNGVCVQIPPNAQGTGPSCQPGYDNPNCNVPGNCGSPSDPKNQCH
jgi:prepilin-type N-terminal cleavage/methylation domain-containing protein